MTLEHIWFEENQWFPLESKHSNVFCMTNKIAQLNSLKWWSMPIHKPKHH